ncbi:GTP cyclohydrolase II [Streptomonospora nanhaiensis]|uniref:GTP cyclohydrolase-2 n=1 Tax=Streptomonospora nanhaiensis TaxID=1323731 RepID=A0ABY6YUN6_9ACTN|nr:GTP cyclohydrolase II [Streptomonospora nanhaiensis]WAE76097.1 GTP cyclohydrolase II [Streptomonospora nanhaiensis]
MSCQGVGGADGSRSDGAGPEGLGTGVPAVGPAAVAEAELATRRGPFRIVALRDPSDGREHAALVLGEVCGGEDVLARAHSECVTGDVFGALRCECGDQLEAALDLICAEGRGVVVYLRGHEGRGIGLVEKVRTLAVQDAHGLDTVDSATALGLPVDVRDYGPAARILLHLGVRSVRLLSNNPAKVRALREHGVEVASRVPLLMPARRENVAYLTAKRDRLGHDLPHLDGPRG